jgi:mannose/cellobiose epimerase-like protein (N-acyl-D-glucosamine 2-epimerase family)
MEAVSSLFAATLDSRFHRFLDQLADTLTERFFDPQLGCIHEHFTTDWLQYHALSRGRVLYGHILEAAWFLAAIGGFEDDRNRLDTAHTLLNYVLDHGWDRLHGGMYMSGRPAGDPVDTGKMWWVQAAALGALSTSWRLTKDEQYRSQLQQLLMRQVAFIERYIRDPLNGAWRLSVEADGTVRCGLKGHGLIDHLPIKGAYHVVQALTQTTRNLDLARGPEKGKRADHKNWSDHYF